jgi:hypothetical protein
MIIQEVEASLKALMSPSQTTIVTFEAGIKKPLFRVLAPRRGIEYHPLLRASNLKTKSPFWGS